MRRITRKKGILLFLATLYFNVAVIHPKQAYHLSTVDFFRDNGGDRALNFDGSLDSLDFASRNINANRYAVLMHKRYRLAGGNVFAQGARPGSKLKIRKTILVMLSFNM